ncbi:50S ribosomal protein L9 [Leucothrix pacifica]|uniref:Large ribosomal subunit protein bL9 n=1 Tax=Leucothrix pacifica TaxID=1247513 RepID=A0A317CUU2_9GAMM|nr:50S ribosomal protein L9 [Leucothrix pacifica]PWR00093.1 50S ribosomal protein L9 [Leucothrix pacifica]
MQVILMEKIDNLGSLGEIVNVRAGFARNFLVPRRKAKIATKANIEAFEEIRAELEKVAAEATAAAEAVRAKLDGTEIKLEANAGSEGKLFGSITNHEIAEALQELGFEVERRNVRMPEGPIRNVGEHEVGIHLHTDVDATVKVIIHSDNVVEVVEKAESIGTFVDED